MRFLTFFNHQQKRIPADWRGLLFVYIPMHEVAPSAVSTAVMTDAMICSVHFSVSLFVIIYLLSCRKCYTFLDDHHNQFPA